MDFDALFSDQLDLLKKEGNYRIFAELERQCGAFPKEHDGDWFQRYSSSHLLHSHWYRSHPS